MRARIKIKSENKDEVKEGEIPLFYFGLIGLVFALLLLSLFRNEKNFWCGGGGGETKFKKFFSRIP